MNFGLNIHLSGLFNDDPERPRKIKTTLFFENEQAVEFLRRKFGVWAYNFGRAQLIARRQKNGTYDVVAKIHAREHLAEALIPETQTVMTGISRDKAIATMYAMEVIGHKGEAPAHNESPQVYLQNQLDKKHNASHVLSLRKRLRIKYDEHMVPDDLPRPMPPGVTAPPP